MDEQIKNPSTEQIRNLIKENSESEISEDLLLESLREHKIRDIESLVKYSIRAHKEAQSRSLGDMFPELANRKQEDLVVELLFGGKAKSHAKDIIPHRHSQPKLPFVLGDTYYKPSEINRFDGKLLHYIWDSNFIGNGFLKAVTDPEEYRAFLANTQNQPNRDMVLRSHVPGAGHTFYQHVNYGGHALSLGYRHAYPDLTKVTMSGWWWWATSWNDQISSLRTGSGWVVLGEHVMRPYLTGATMTVNACTSIPWIGYAWNDRVSAILG